MADRKRILIADDDPDLVELIRLEMVELGHEIFTASNGEVCLESILKNKPDLVLLDVMMPKLDGYHVAYEVTSRLGEQAPNIIIITSRDTVREKGVATMSGAAAVLQKPFSLADLRKTVLKVLGEAPNP